jgi:hypothetical protein
VQIGQKTTVTVAARPLWNDTGVVLDQGHRYRFTATGQWIDWYINCGPAGYPSPNLVMRLGEGARRVPNQPWFALIGAIARDSSSQFPIGAGCNYQAASGGELTCFANDVPGFYWNNKGQVQLTIERLD